MKMKCFNILGHSNWIISFPILDVTTIMRAGRLLLLSYYLPAIFECNLIIKFIMETILKCQSLH